MTKMEDSNFTLDSLIVHFIIYLLTYSHNCIFYLVNIDDSIEFSKQKTILYSSNRFNSYLVTCSRDHFISNISK